jgi:hypothetical protein
LAGNGHASPNVVGQQVTGFVAGDPASFPWINQSTNTDREKLKVILIGMQNLAFVLDETIYDPLDSNHGRSPRCVHP